MGLRAYASALLFTPWVALACSSQPSNQNAGSGGTVGSGGATQGGSTTGGLATGGAQSGGTAQSGGAQSGGAGGTTTQGGTTNASGGTAPGLGGSASGGTGTSGGGSGGVSGAAGSLGGGGSAGASGGAGGAGGSGAGGTSGAGGPGGGSAGKAGACDKALFCDDFESYTSGMAPGSVWTPRTSSGTVSVVETQHRSGSKSVKFATDAKDGTKTAFIRLKSNSVFPVTGNVFYGRLMYFLEAAPNGDVHWTLLQSTGTVPGQNYRAQYRYGGQHPVMQNNMFVGSQWMANYDTPDSYSGTGPSSDCWIHANSKVAPVGKWTCVEWKFDGAQNQMRFWLDGTAYDDLSLNGKGQGCVHQDASYTWTAPTFGDIEIGWESYQNDQARTIYIDDVAISTTQIGCPG